MGKKLIPNKVIIEFDNGVFVSGVILYKVNDGGEITRVKTTGIKNADFSKPLLNGLLQKFIKHAESAEGIQE
ncbi:MAG: hypothetical protein COV73_04335 [Candidatus Omnitrophica bacterium CG11_big_fil_rev_8_21_14_0_20_43_6]|nr:MAG: hypothetical protein COV73_04335 [Candidatus Omnitrophica bacterium CG11_big_fil_rev_8_21_14_0_20_43_6]